MTDQLFYFTIGLVGLALFLSIVWMTFRVAGHGWFSSKREHISRVLGMANREDTNE